MINQRLPAFSNEHLERMKEIILSAIAIEASESISGYLLEHVFIQAVTKAMAEINIGTSTISLRKMAKISISAMRNGRNLEMFCAGKLRLIRRLGLGYPVTISPQAFCLSQILMEIDRPEACSLLPSHEQVEVAMYELIDSRVLTLVDQDLSPGSSMLSETDCVVIQQNGDGFTERKERIEHVLLLPGKILCRIASVLPHAQDIYDVFKEKKLLLGEKDRLQMQVVQLEEQLRLSNEQLDEVSRKIAATLRSIPDIYKELY